jgi:hypothetical protein
MEERLLLHRVYREGADVPPRDPQAAGLVGSDLADSAVPFEDQAPMAARETAQAFVRQALVEGPFGGEAVESVLDRLRGGTVAGGYHVGMIMRGEGRQ